MRFVDEQEAARLERDGASGRYAVRGDEMYGGLDSNPVQGACGPSRFGSSTVMNHARGISALEPERTKGRSRRSMSTRRRMNTVTADPTLIVVALLAFVWLL